MFLLFCCVLAFLGGELPTFSLTDFFRSRKIPLLCLFSPLFSPWGWPGSSFSARSPPSSCRRVSSKDGLPRLRCSCSLFVSLSLSLSLSLYLSARASLLSSCFMFYFFALSLSSLSISLSFSFCALCTLKRLEFQGCLCTMHSEMP